VYKTKERRQRVFHFIPENRDLSDLPSLGSRIDCSVVVVVDELMGYLSIVDAKIGQMTKNVKKKGRHCLNAIIMVIIAQVDFVLVRNSN